MHIIGLTGGIASGKTTVSTILKEEFDTFIIDADLLARRLTQRGMPAYEDIVNKFGHDIISLNGQIDRKKLGEIVFRDQMSRKELEKITHSRIWEETNQLIKNAASGTEIIVVDAPLLIEAGWQNKVDELWLVYLERQTQLARLIKRDNLSLKAAEERILSQLPLNEKKKHAQIIIDNSGSLEKTREQVIFYYRATYCLLREKNKI